MSTERNITAQWLEEQLAEMDHDTVMRYLGWLMASHEKAMIQTLDRMREYDRRNRKRLS